MSLKFTRMVAKVQGLKPVPLAVLRLLADMSDKSGRCFPSQPYLAEATGWSARTIWAAMQTLEAAGWIVREHRQRRDGSRTSDLVTIQDLESAARIAAASLKLPLMAIIPGDRGFAEREENVEKSNSQILRDGQLAGFARHEPTTSIDSRLNRPLKTSGG